MMGTDANALADLDGWTEPHGENGVRLRLEYPLRYGERVNGGAETERCWEHLTFRRPRAREFRMLEATGGIAGSMILAAKSATNFDEAINNVEAITGVTGKTSAKMRQQAKDLGRTTAFSASQAAEAMTFLGMAGLNAEKVMQAMPGTLQLAAASGLDLASAADIATNVVGGLGLTIADLPRVNDVLAQSQRKANTNIVEMSEALKAGGGFASSAGLELETITAILGKFADAGIKGSEAGTALKIAIGRILKPSDEASEALARLDLWEGEEISEQGKIRDFVGLLGKLQESGAKAADIMTIFGAEAGGRIATLLQQPISRIKELEATLLDAGGTAEEMAKIKMKGMPGLIKKLSSAIEGLVIAIGEKLLPVLTPLIARLTEFISNNMEAIGQRFGKSFQAIGDALRAIDWEAFGNTFRSLNEKIKKAIGFVGGFENALLIVGAVLAGGLIADILSLGAAFVKLGATLLSNPIVAAALAIGLAVYAIYDNWDGVVAWFDNKVARLGKAFDEGFLQGIAQAIVHFNPTVLLAEGINGLIEYLTGIDLFASGAKLIASFSAGIASKFPDLHKLLAGIGRFLGFGDDDEASPNTALGAVQPRAETGVPAGLLAIDRAFDGIGRLLGFGDDDEDAPEPKAGLAAGVRPPLLAPTQQIRGKILVESADPRLRLRPVERSPNLDLETENRGNPVGYGSFALDSERS